MHTWVLDDVDTVIDRYALHEGGVPVDLSVLEDMFPVRYQGLGTLGLSGLVLPPPDGWPASSANRARVVIDPDAGDSRLVYAHEVGHGLCQHLGATVALSLDMDNRMEREAWKVAAHLLIPVDAVTEYGDVASIAAACGVPEWLVQLWQ